MSRVWSNQKFVNMPNHTSDVTGPGKVVRVHTEGEDYHNASSLRSWLFIKYDMSYETYKRKSKKRRHEMRREFEEDTGRNKELFGEFGDKFSFGDQIAKTIKAGSKAIINDLFCYSQGNTSHKDTVFFYSDVSGWKLAYIGTVIDENSDETGLYCTRVTWFDSDHDKDLIRDFIDENDGGFLYCLSDIETIHVMPGLCKNICPQIADTGSFVEDKKSINDCYHAAMLADMEKDEFINLILDEAYQYHQDGIVSIAEGSR